MSLRFLTAGESHGPRLTAILEGLPAGLPVDPGAIDADLLRRQQGFGSGGRMRIERDRVVITGGVMDGHTTGAPVAMDIHNRDWANWRDRDVPPMTVPRPGHADLSAAVKYGYRELRLSLERASARETAARVAVGAMCRLLLGAFGVRVGAYTVSIGSVTAELAPIPPGPDADAALHERFEAAESNDLRCPDPDALDAMRAAIRAAIGDRDTLGGIIEIIAVGVPAGLGSHVHWDRRLSGRLVGAMASIPAIKGAEIGTAFDNATRRGTEVHDRFRWSESPVDDPAEEGPSAAEANRRIVRASNRGGGIEGGITTGAPVVVRAAMKPISTTLTPLESVDLATGEPARTTYERSDFCAVPRAAVVAEAMMCFVLADALLEKTGGDSVDEIAPRVRRLRTGKLSELPMDDRPWRLGYDDITARPIDGPPREKAERVDDGPGDDGHDDGTPDDGA